MSENVSMTAISLFSGAGGMDVGFQAAGYDVLLANDIDPDACATYRLNHGDVIFEGTVVALLPLLRHVKDIDLVFGGPPCQGFSVAGKMDPADPRSSLTSSFFDAVDAVQPRAFVCENVKALAVLEKWAKLRQRLLERANERYHAALIVLNAHDFGVPQSRERMFIVGVRKDVFGRTRPEFTDALVAAIEAEKSLAPTIEDVVRKLGRAGSKTNPRVCKAKITYARSPVMRRSPYAGMLFNGAGRPLSPTGTSSTLPASMGGNKTPIVDEGEIFDGLPSFVEEYHAQIMSGYRPKSGKAPSRLRRLTVDECLAIQTFPAGYRLSGSQSAAYRQIGNAVPCSLAEAVANAVTNLLAVKPVEQDVEPLRLASVE
jgi:DNA (cytosine-5)-methyltransferase 1